ncbi:MULTISPECIES: ornithine carbamoyltransferase [Caldilinea]|jgi:ornithine carbamoyltransferase|uniref:Ornithine carbamoyltransferase n=2 Tax=Caldilinea TaxID=233191 RepID=I0I3B3_CALAS|nr:MULTISPECIES: ornithine carbamoyltransferase [Caldilinea]MBO9394032.1 ornithine carbamoyltransferase [Caldilinea sp.]BAL99750.1 ornithine carbamoyltransferase [Caldilinea aerophila DSM 14535 = NBRC 104270]GIV73650.1 MAG: ornithine carbamoyltransferase [Caldilinea sp.]
MNTMIPALSDFIDLQHVTSDQFWGLLRLARELKEERTRLGQNAPILAGKSLALLFQKPSLRTRVSFEMGMVQLGGYAFYLSPQEVGLGQRESIADVARVLSGYCDGIMARVFDHNHIIQLAQWATVPVINGLSDFSHPCQALADLFTIWERLGKLEGLTLAFVGDGSNNVATSLIMAAGKVGMNVRIISPKGYTPDPKIVADSNANVTVTEDLDGVAGVDVIYTDVWTSMGQESEREERLRIFPPYQVNRDLVARTGNSDVLVMHCLPAHRGEEITDAVADGPNSVLFPQAHNRLHAQKALLAHLLGNIPLK